MNFWRTLATLGPLGYIPYIPGTAASIPGLLLGWYLNNSFPAGVVFLIIFVLIGMAIVISNIAENFFPQKDDRRIVIDELVGMLLAAFGIKSWFWLFLAFFLFRLFDVTKILGIRQLQKLPGGWGIVADDLVAGVYSQVVILIFHYGKFIFMA